MAKMSWTIKNGAAQEKPLTAGRRNCSLKKHLHMSKTFYIIDGHAQIYAAFYAPTQGNLTAPNGESTKATYIFTTILLKILREQKPDMLVVAMDSPEPSFRHKIYEQYKANRPPMPEDLIVQINRIEDVLQGLRIPILRLGGYEADDIIGTLAQKGAAKGYMVYICSKDKDLEQLISDQVVMFDPKSSTIFDLAALKEKKGIRPDQVIDVLALEGDKSDNVPGVADVGPKTALQWMQKYGSLEELLAHRDEIKGKRGENLRTTAEQLKLSRKLVTIDLETPIEFDWNELTVKSPDRTQLEKVFSQLGFRRLLDRMDEIAPEFSAGPSSKRAAHAIMADKPYYHLVDTPQEFENFFNQLKKQKIFALDTETTGLNPVAAELVGLSFSWQDGEGYYLPVKAPLGQKCLDRQKTLQRLKPILTNPQIKKIGQNIKYDIIVLRRAGIEPAGVEFDTMVASYVLYSHRSRHSLDSMALDYLGHDTIKLESLIGKGKNQLTFDMVDTKLAADYAAEDAEVTWRLKEYLAEILNQSPLRQLFEEVEMPLVEVLAEMEYHGVALDVGWLKKLSGQLAERMEELVAHIHRQAGMVFNVDSPKQLSQVLFERLGLGSLKKTKLGRSTDQEVLEALSWQHPVAKMMLEYRQLSKLKNTYVDKLPTMICPQTKRVHASFNQAVTATGRLSSSDPNLQNIPIRTQLGQEIRRSFVTGNPNEVILSADYSQIELRLLAHFSKDAVLREAFASGQDIHRFVAAQVYGLKPDQVDKTQRDKAKAVNFGIIYGQTAYGLSHSIGVSVTEAQQFIDDYFARYPDIRDYFERVISQARKEGCVHTILGRKRVISDINSQTAARRRLAERMAVNTVIQGSAADLIKVAMINIHRRSRRENLQMKMILQVHDELVFELPEEHAADYAEIIRHEMADAIKLEVPIVVQVSWGQNWLECK